jgi:hypothetical protein
VVLCNSDDDNMMMEESRLRERVWSGLCKSFLEVFRGVGVCLPWDTQPWVDPEPSDAAWLVGGCSLRHFGERCTCTRRSRVFRLG